MKLLAAIMSTVLLLSILLAPVTSAEDCSCGAKDGSCTASVSCPAGCISLCPSGGCSATCIKKKGSGEGDLDLAQEVTLQMEDSSSKRLISELARMTRQEIVFVPYKPGETFNLDIKSAPLWDVLEILSQRGKVQVGGESFERLRTIREALLGGESMSVCVRNASVGDVVYRLAYLTGLPIRVTAGDTHTLVNMTLKGVTLEDAVQQLSARTGVQIALR